MGMEISMSEEVFGVITRVFDVPEPADLVGDVSVGMNTGKSAVIVSYM